MIKKLWIIINIITLLITGVFLSQGLCLFLQYNDMRMGVIMLATGFSTALLYAWSINRLTRKKPTPGRDLKTIWKTEKHDATLSSIIFILVFTGFIIYQYRFYRNSIILINAFKFALSLPLFVVLCINIMNYKKHSLIETNFRNSLLQLCNAANLNTHTCYDTVSEEITFHMIVQKTHRLKYFIISLLIIIAIILRIMLKPQKQRILLVTFYITAMLLLFMINIVTMVLSEKEIINPLDNGHSKSVLGFFLSYYESFDARAASLLPPTQSYAIFALCDLGMYEEAYALLPTIKKLAKFENYYFSLKLICLEGLKNQGELLLTLDDLSKFLKTKKGRKRKSLKEMQTAYDLYHSLATGEYEQTITLIQQLPPAPVRTMRQREKLLEDAQNKIWG